LLRSDGSFSKESKNALQALLLDGLTFSVASARSVVSMRPILDGLSLNLPVIGLNGAFLTDIHTGRHEIVNSIESAAGREILEAIESLGHCPIVSTFDGQSDWLYYKPSTNDGERHYIADRRSNNDSRLRLTDNFTGCLGEQVVCLTVIGTAEPLSELRLSILEQYGELVEIHFFENRYTPGWFWLTIHDRRATKDQAVELLRASYGLGEHELIVFGDHTNDVKMFKAATRAVAVGNAHPEVLRLATETIGSNDEDSVVRFIRKHAVSVTKS
jgi:Cof subfamily protein (haloacid dehalogenase superfamily)